MLTGSLVALVTPMFEDGRLDLASLQKLVDFHINAGTSCIVSMGTTGESATLDYEEHLSVVEATVKAAAGRIPVMAGTGANSTKEAIELTRRAKLVGVDSVLSVVPYYNKPTQEGMFQHFKAIAEAVDIPLFLYNVPGRTVADIDNDTVLRLAKIPNIVGLKDATGDLARAADLGLRAPKSFARYTGDDATGLAFMLLGGHGVISVTSNVAPKLMCEMCDAALRGDLLAARAANDKLQGLHRHLFIEANPIPAKWAVSKLGFMTNSLRLPLTPLTPASEAPLRAAMQQAGLSI